MQLYRDLGGEYLRCGRERGLYVGLWDAWPTADRAELALSYKPDMYCAQAETGQGPACMQAIGEAYARGFRQLAVVSNMEPSRTMGASFDRYMTSRNVSMHPEAYPDNEDWKDDLPGLARALHSECVNRGYRSVYVVPGVYAGRTIADYRLGTMAHAPYLAEYLTPEELYQ